MNRDVDCAARREGTIDDSDVDDATESSEVELRCGKRLLLALLLISVTFLTTPCGTHITAPRVSFLSTSGTFGTTTFSSLRPSVPLRSCELVDADIFPSRIRWRRSSARLPPFGPSIVSRMLHKIVQASSGISNADSSCPKHTQMNKSMFMNRPSEMIALSKSLSRKEPRTGRSLAHFASGILGSKCPERLARGTGD